jgi:hypothetical protein
MRCRRTCRVGNNGNWFFADLVRLARRCRSAARRMRTGRTGNTDDRLLHTDPGWNDRHRTPQRTSRQTRGPDSLAPQLMGIGATTSPAPGHLLNTPEHSDRKISSVKYSSSVAYRTHGRPPSSGSRSVPNAFANRYAMTASVLKNFLTLVVYESPAQGAPHAARAAEAVGKCCAANYPNDTVLDIDLGGSLPCGAGAGGKPREKFKSRFQEIGYSP